MGKRWKSEIAGGKITMYKIQIKIISRGGTVSWRFLRPAHSITNYIHASDYTFNTRKRAAEIVARHYPELDPEKVRVVRVNDVGE